MKTDLFQSYGHCWVFQICWHIECSTLTASSFRIWNSSAEIPSSPLALLVVILPKAHLPLHSRMRWPSPRKRNTKKQNGCLRRPYKASLQTKLVEVMEFQLSYFKSWKMILWKCSIQYASKFGKLSSGHRTGKGQFSFQSQRKAMPKDVQTTAQLHSSHTLVK